MAELPKMSYFLFENKAFFNNFLPIDRSLIDNDFGDFDVNNLEIILTILGF
jgi:hypothetical protein